MDRGRALGILSLLLIAAGVAALVVAGLRGEAEVHIVVIIPVISGTGPVFALGALLFFAGVFLGFLSVGLGMLGAAGAVPLDDDVGTPRGEPLTQGPQRGAPAGGGGAQWGGVVFIGPIPIAFGSNPRMNRLMLVAAIVMAVLFFVFLLGLLR